MSTPQLERWGLPKLPHADPEVAALLSEIERAIVDVCERRIGPYGALEAIVSAIDDYAKTQEED